MNVAMVALVAIGSRRWGTILTIESAAFSQFRRMLEDEMSVWFRVRGLLLIGETVEDVEVILKEEVGADADGDGMLG